MKYKLISFLCLFMLSCASIPKIGFNSSQQITKLTDSVVQIMTEYEVYNVPTHQELYKRFLATGFSVKFSDGNSYIITNQHVCSMQRRAKYVLQLTSGYIMEAYFVRIDRLSDLCMLKTEAFIEPLDLAYDNAFRGERITVIGGPSGVFPLMTDGIVSGYVDIKMGNDKVEDGYYNVFFRAQLISAPIYPGSSGSPVFNVDAKVVGVVFASQIGSDHISYMVPVSELQRFLYTKENVFIK